MTKQFYENEPGVCDECGIAHSQFNDCPTKKKSEPQMNATNKETQATGFQTNAVREQLTNLEEKMVGKFDKAEGEIVDGLIRSLRICLEQIDDEIARHASDRASKETI